MWIFQNAFFFFFFFIIFQQSEDEVKKLKAKVTELEVALSASADKCASQDALEEEVKTLKAENLQSGGKIRDLQAELVSMYAKSPEVR